MRWFSLPRWVWIGLGILAVSGGLAIFLMCVPAWPPFMLWVERSHEAMTPASPSMASMDGMASGMKRDTQASAVVPPQRQQLIGLKTAVVEKHRLTTTVRAMGRVDYDEQRIVHVNLRTSGWVEKVFINETGQYVRKGQPLLTLYSQELATAQEEYLLALEMRDQLQRSPLPEVREQAEQIVTAAHDRLRLWSLTEAQIQELARRGAPHTTVTVFSPIAGYVIEKQVFPGMYVEPKTNMYSIADLSTIWVQAEIFEYEVPFVRTGQAAMLTVEAYPGEQFPGRITYVYPYLNEAARTVTVRLEFSNPALRLKPGMYGIVELQVDRGMKLAVPAQAVLDSGKRRVVFVLREAGLFEPRQIAVGPRVGAYYEVVEGLVEGERVVVSGTFLLDSESRLMASEDMMGALGMGGIKMEQATMGKMEMGGMTMSGTDNHRNQRNHDKERIERPHD
ncbi:MAG: efflux RND transporter periplasmic adaptor subunit [Nitrospirae bacterium]|nr:MAG: efflux RND transporter periplasmic adaptor subunit [Nitrospirota bacterium]